MPDAELHYRRYTLGHTLEEVMKFMHDAYLNGNYPDESKVLLFKSYDDNPGVYRYASKRDREAILEGCSDDD